MERCIDASLAAKWYLRGEHYRGKALQILRESQTAGIRMIAPPLFVMELDGIVQSRVADGIISSDAADRILEAIDFAPIVIIDHPETRRRARQIARLTDQRKVYDATYAALAELRGCDFWTADRAFYEAVRADLSFVKYLADYP